MIEKEVAIIYRGGDRRWLTLQGAVNAEAKKKIKSRCECYYGNELTSPELCEYHNDIERYAKIKRRLAKIYLNNYLNGGAEK